MVRDLHIEPLLAIYAGYSLDHEYVNSGSELQPYVHDALDEIGLLTGDTSTRWGAVRAKLGHPRAFVFHYVEAGNEDEFDPLGSYEGSYEQFTRE